MNKIVIDKDNLLSLENEEIIIECISNDILINIKGNVVINEIITTDKKIKMNIKMYPNSSLVYNRYVHKTGGSFNLDIESTNNTNLEFNNSLFLDTNYDISINNNINGNNNNNLIDIKSFNILEGKIKAQGYLNILKNTKLNNLVENFKIITNNLQENIIIPALVVDSDDVIANHYTTISPIDTDELFYLSLKGIDKNTAQKLLRNSIILKNFNNKFMIESIKKLLEKE